MSFEHEASMVLIAARAKGLRIATAESCTGGMISASLTAIAGASDVFDRGYVTYSNAAKIEMLGVTQSGLARFGAVSEQVAKEMADGARRGANAIVALSVTGIAGPGGSENKPEGRVCFGVATVQTTHVETVDFGAIGRDAVRSASTAHALSLLKSTIETL